MEVFTGRLRKVGNSLSVLIPKAVLEGLGVGPGDEVEVALLPPHGVRMRRRRQAIGSFPALAAFRRDREDRY